jgi:hypothetical protein
MDAMFLRAHPGRDGIPKHRRQHWAEAGQIGDHSLFNKPIDSGHHSLIEKRVDYLPVSCIPANE